MAPVSTREARMLPVTLLLARTVSRCAPPGGRDRETMMEPRRFIWDSGRWNMTRSWQKTRSPAKPHKCTGSAAIRTNSCRFNFPE